MKKLILFLTILLISVNLFAYEEGPGFYAEYSKDFYSDITYTDIEVHYTLKFWQLELQPFGGTQTYFISNDSLIFGGKPFLDVYSWGSRLKYKNIIFQYEHFCAHPVMSDYTRSREDEATIYSVNNGMMGENSDRFSIRYEFN